jgi:hypothetical protein
MSLITNWSEAATGGYTTVIQRTENGVAGMRVLSEPFTTLAVYTFPFSAIAQAARLDALQQKPGTYLLCSTRAAKAYVGETGNLADRLRAHTADPTKQFATEVFIIASKDESIQKIHAEFGQRYLYDAAEKAGLVTLVNDKRPHWVDLQSHEVGEFARKLSDVQRPLFDGGCRVFHDSDPAMPSSAAAVETEETIHHAPAQEEDDDCEMVMTGLTTVPLGVEESDLKYFDLWARGYTYKGRFIVAAGSEVFNDISPRVITGIVKKRNTLEARGLLAPIAGVSDRMRLMAPLDLCSKDNAANFCSGAMIDSSSWRPLARNTATVIDL